MLSYPEFPELEPFLAGADHIDAKTIDGTVTMREFLASAMSYQPSWMTFLYRVRSVFVRFLGMRQDEMPQPQRFRPEDVPMTPGQLMLFFNVRLAQDGRIWVADIDDTHLRAALALLVVEIPEGRRFQLVTIVHYKHWTGKVYFNVIRPFHHLVIHMMAKAGVEESLTTRGA